MTSPILQQFLPSGPCPAQLMIVGEAPGENEVREKLPFVGASGHLLDKMLQEVGLSRTQAFVTNVSRVRPAGNDIDEFVSTRKTSPGPQWSYFQGRWVREEIVSGLALLREEVQRVQPNLIICFGNLALWALTGHWGVKSWRGCVLTSGASFGTERKVLCTYHPAAVLRQLSLRPTVVHDLGKAAREYLSPERSATPERTFVIRPTLAQVRKTIGALIEEADDYATQIRAGNGAQKLKLAPDIETRAGHIACIGFAWSRTEAICIPFMDTTAPTGYWSLEEEVEVVFLLYQLLTHPGVECVGQNWLYDAQYIWRHWHFLVAKVRDTMIAQHAMFSYSQKSLDFLASLYDPDYVYWKDDGKRWEPGMGEEQLWTYNCVDCIETYIVDEGQGEAAETLHREGWAKLPYVTAFQQRLFAPVVKMMNRGIRPNLDLKLKMSMDLFAAADERQRWINEVVGHPLNVGSTKQMQAFFYDELGQTKNWMRHGPGVPWTVTCNDEALEKIALREPILRSFIRKIQELRSIGVFQSTFVSMRLDRDGRIRCSFGIAATKTYRFNSSKNAFDSGTNLQNVPSGDEDEPTSTLPNVRKLFIPDPGHEIFDIDLDSADLRVVTGESGCVWMREQFAAGNKPYVEIGKQYDRDPSFSKRSPRYRIFKALCHGTNYLGTPPGLASRIGLLVHEVDRMQKWYYGLCPEIKVWQDELKKQISGRGYIENVWGHRYFFRERITDKTFNEGVAWIPQSTVGILINHGLCNIDETLPWAQLLLQVHDSLVGQYPSIMGGEARRAIVEACTVPLPYETPLVIPVGIKVSRSSWGECETPKA